jgi:ferric-dicitrate binding protein FerR (iron transport regulator)
MSTEERIRDLLKRYADNQASEAEIAEMLKGLHEEGGDTALETVMKEIFNERGPVHSTVPADWEAMWGNIKKNTAPPVRKMFWLRVAAAVVVVSMLSVTGYFYFNNNRQEQVARRENDGELKNDAAPAGNRAVLTLADGREILLDSGNANGTLTQQGNTKIIKLNDGELVYNSSSEKPGEILYNTITTPKGGQYQVILADGSKVWLNAASSLRFPTTFSERERRVDLSGEVYFEVEENPAKPFIVSSIAATADGEKGVEVKVLGTHFNVNAYDDEAGIKVSLLKGRVQVANMKKDNIPGAVLNHIDTKILKPGEQAVLIDSKNILVNNNVDMDEVMAWKNGFFSFSNADLQSVMRQLARWYDVDVVYEGTIPKRQFEGKMQRNLNLSEVLKIIETNNVHFKINGKKIVVNP